MWLGGDVLYKVWGGDVLYKVWVGDELYSLGVFIGGGWWLERVCGGLGKKAFL